MSDEAVKMITDAAMAIVAIPSACWMIAVIWKSLLK